MAGRKVWAADEILAAADLQSYIQDQVVFVYANASARTSGILAPSEGMVSYLQDTNLLYTFDGSSWVQVTPTSLDASVITSGTLNAARLPASGVSSGTYTKVGVDTTGRVVTAGLITAGDVPTIGISQVSGLQTSLDSKLNLSGGTISGTLTMTSNITSNSQIFTSNQFRTTGTVWADGDVRGGTMSADNSIACGATYNQANAPARAMYVNSGGVFGIGSSSRRFKKNIVDANYDVDTIRQILVRHFEYKEEFGGDGTQEVGVIAEELVAIGLEDFVYFEDDGQAKAVAYDKLALLALTLAQDVADRIDAVEARLAKLEK